MKKQTKLGLVLAAAALISVSVASLVSARGWVQEGAEWRYVGNDGEFVTDTIQTSGNAKFYLNEDGYMVKDYFLEEFNDNTYYFGANGAMVTNTWVAINSEQSENQGDYVPDNYWYYFQASGKAVKGSNGKPKKMTIDGKRYLFNEHGQMCVGWVDKDGNTIDPDSVDDGGPFMEAVYYAGGDNDGALRAGWVTYYDGYSGNGDDYLTDKSTLYFYFNTSNNQKFPDGQNPSAKTKKINGKTYAFNEDGVMLSGWDVADDQELNLFKNKVTYFSGEDDGHQVKKGWIYAVPAQYVDDGAYEDGEEKYFYFNGSGDAVKNSFKKINGKTYVFNHHGIMKTGVVIWCPASFTPDTSDTTYKQKFVDTVDLDWADGEKIAKAGKIYVGDNKGIIVDKDGNWKSDFPTGTTNDYKSGLKTGDKIELHYFGDDGARKLNANTVNFADDAYTLFTTTSGHKPSGESQKKYYSLGLQCKASSDIKYGLFKALNSTGGGSLLDAEKSDYIDNLNQAFNSNYIVADTYKVLNTSGSLQKGSKNSKKDANDHYWLISKADTLEGIYTVDVKRLENYGIGTIVATLSDLAPTAAPTVPAGETKQRADVLLSEVVTNLGVIADKSSKENITKQIFGVAWNTDKNYTYSPSDIASCIDDDGYLVFVETDPVDGKEAWSAFYYGYQFKSDRFDKSVWMAFGAYDNVGKTAAQSDSTHDEYRVELDDSYFLNCYWNANFAN